MQLESVQFKHVGMFRDLTVEFHPAQRPITLILGDQATGKTTVLKKYLPSSDLVFSTFQRYSNRRRGDF